MHKTTLIAPALDSVAKLAGSKKGDGSKLPERPGGCFAQNGPVPFLELYEKVVCSLDVRSALVYIDADWVYQYVEVSCRAS